MTWSIRHSHAFKDYLLDGSPYFVARPNYTAHAHAIGLPHGYRYAIYESGGDPSGCAAKRGIFRTLREAKDTAESLVQA